MASRTRGPRRPHTEVELRRSPVSSPSPDGHAGSQGHQAPWSHSIPDGERLHEEACAGNPQAGFCEGEAHNGAGSTTVTRPTPKGGSNREYTADLTTGGVLPTRPRGPICCCVHGLFPPHRRESLNRSHCLSRSYQSRIRCQAAVEVVHGAEPGHCSSPDQFSPLCLTVQLKYSTQLPIR
jgi:hypothetical protein